MKTISLDNEVIQTPGNLVSDMNGEKVMLSVKNGKYYNLGEVGGEIWMLLEKPITANQIISALIQKFDVNEDECREQVTVFLEHLYREDLIENY
ncbi:lasso peptide biosynthesis PqqD family chaperone [Peribacillus sp. SCS-37]|uniref:lasso peptide biosynthesis PqqD family chaperone n=1 Tax=Paraperibacillus esterisolvens TaxID=3115296 RepID=UPI00390580A5